MGGFLHSECLIMVSSYEYLLNPLVHSASASSYATQEQIDDILLYQFRENYDESRRYFTHDFDGVTNNVSTKSNSEICFGMPLAGFENARVDRKDQDKIADTWFKGGLQSFLKKTANYEGPDMLIYYDMGLFNGIRQSEWIIEDVTMCIGAVCLIFVVLLIYMQSLFLASFAMLQVLLSFPITFYIYKVLLDIQLFGALNCISLFGMCTKLNWVLLTFY